MNTGPDSMRPNDAPHDPLLDALRQRLGDSYGAPPPPGAWAGIRQRLPARPPLPWWRRPRRLLPLLLLLPGIITVGTLAERQLGSRSFISLISRKTTASHSHSLALTPPPATSPLASQREPASRSAATATAPRQPSSVSQQESSSIAPATGAVAALPPHVTRAAGSAVPAAGPLASHPTTRQPLAAVPSPEASHRRHRLTGLSNKELAQPRVASQLSKAYQANRAALPMPTDAAAAAGSGAGAATASRRPGRARLAVAAGLAVSAQASGTARAGHASERRVSSPRHREAAAARRAQPDVLASQGLVAPPAPTEATKTLDNSLVATTSPQPLQVDSLALKLAALARLPAAPLPSLIPRPDSASPFVPGRRWSLLAVVGPTLSYRTIGTATTEPVTTVTSPNPTATAPPGNSIGTKPNVTHVERPAAGLAAQVQVRRVLSGRWALALGVGYQEYATGLSLKTSADSSTSLYQRDTYRFLTLPAQLTYVLGAPHSRLAKGLCLGAVPGWYQGGSSTAGSSSNQQHFSSVAGSPYHAWNLALNLGLDLRYRIGRPASHWQVVVQPTAHYILTPFVRSEATGFSQRQPFSLGVLTGVSLDIR